MDFDSIIMFLFIMAFFVLPSILKQIQARKKKTAKPKKTKKMPSIFGRIGDQFRNLKIRLNSRKRKSVSRRLFGKRLQKMKIHPLSLKVLGRMLISVSLNLKK